MHCWWPVEKNLKQQIKRIKNVSMWIVGFYLISILIHFTTCKTTGYKFFLKKYSFNKISAIIRDGRGDIYFRSNGNICFDFWSLHRRTWPYLSILMWVWAPICFHFFPLYPHSRLQWLQNFNVRPYWTGIARNLNLLCLCIYINLK